jgi:hypothetical protein
MIVLVFIKFRYMYRYTSTRITHTSSADKNGGKKFVLVVHVNGVRLYL